MSASNEEINQLLKQDYKQGFVTVLETDTFPVGLDEAVIHKLSKVKNEPEFMLEYRLKAFRHWQTMTPPEWAFVKFDPIDYQSISYYSAPKRKEDGPKSLDEIDPQVLEAYKKLGIPLDEQERLAGIAVDAVFDSVSVATTFKGKLNDVGVIFCPISEALREHPELIKEYLGSVVPPSDNYFAALNAAVFTDGSFVYIPKGVRCPMELSTYFRINAANTGQFERTLIIADEGSHVSYLEGCHPAGEQVLTPKGWQGIETLRAGDNVYDHNGQVQRVNALMVRNYRGDMITVRPVSRHNSFRLTTEHPVLAIKRHQVQVRCVNGGELLDVNKLLTTQAEWLPARLLEQDDFVLLPKDLATIESNGDCYETHSHYLVPVAEISYQPFDDLVYNIEVENTHSYLVKGVAVHNCTAPMRDENQLHAAVVELIALKDATIKYSTVQNWYPGDKNGLGGIYNFVTKRADCRGENSKVSWTQVETGSAITWKYPRCILTGDNSIGEFYSVAVTNNYQQADTGTKMIHIGKNTRSTIVSKGISAGKAQNTYRGLVKVLKSAENARNYTQCDSLLVGDRCGAHTFPYIEVKHPTAQIEHEATTSKISEDQLFFCQQRGLSAEDAVSMIVNGFCKEVFRELPMEFAVEAQALLGLSLEGSVG